MHYELAKALEDAGFPAGGKGSYVTHPDKIVVRREDRVYCPTLSELIEACGEKFDSLIYYPHKIGEKWKADAQLDVGHGYSCDGSTPEIAVARLWLALNKK